MFIYFVSYYILRYQYAANLAEGEEPTNQMIWSSSISYNIEIFFAIPVFIIMNVIVLKDCLKEDRLTIKGDIWYTLAISAVSYALSFIHLVHGIKSFYQ